MRALLHARALVLATVSGVLCIAGPALARDTVVRGFVDDPRGDNLPAFIDATADLKRVSMQYDATRGELEWTLQFWAPGPGSGIGMRFAVGPQCENPTVFYDIGGGRLLHVRNQTLGDEVRTTNGSGTRVTIRYSDPALRDLDLRCVTHTYLPDSGGETFFFMSGGSDFFDRFMLR